MLIHHVLPGEIDGNTTWFYRQNPFEQQETLRQVAFKRQRWPTLEDGRNIRFPGHIYPHILPDGYVRLAFYEPLAEAILSYLQDEDIALHTEVLKSEKLSSRLPELSLPTAPGYPPGQCGPAALPAGPPGGNRDRVRVHWSTRGDPAIG